MKSDTADYGPAVHAIIADQLGKKLITMNDKAPPVVQRRVGSAQVRSLQFREWTVTYQGHSINLQDPQNAEAVLMQMQGHDVVDPCGCCERGGAVLQGCVVGDGFGKGECANCHYGSRGTKCSFRKDSKCAVP